MKKFYLMLLLLTAVVFNVQSQVWQSMNSGITTPLYAVRTIDNLHAVAVGGSGVILKTNNGGINWTQIASGTTEDLNSVSFPTTSVGYAAGANGTVLKTTNGGDSWSAVNVPVAIGLKSVFFTTASIGYVAGNGGYMYRTINGGNTWVALTTNTGSNSIYALFFTNDCTGWFSGDQWYYIDNTVDCGATWTSVNTPDPGINYGLYFLNSTTGFMVNDLGSIVKTTDGGGSYTSVYSSTIGKYGIWFHTNSVGWAVGAMGRLWETNDGGGNWTEHMVGGSNLYGVHFYNSTTGYAVGSNGKILKYYDQFTVTFHVTDDSYVALSGASVTFNGTTQTTNASGNTTFNNVIAGNYAYIVSKSGYTTYSNSVSEPGNDPVQVQLSAEACSAPNSGYASGITQSSANLSWNAGGSETAWNLQWDTQGFVLGNGTIVSGISNIAYSLSGLLANTDYDFYIQSDCGLSQSSWSGPYSFTTLSSNSCTTCPSFDYSITPDVNWQTHSDGIQAEECIMYKVAVMPGYTYIFTTGCQGGSISNFDTQLYLYEESACSEIAFDDDACPNYASEIAWLCNYASAGYVYLKVKGYNSYFGNYTMAYNFTDLTTHANSVMIDNEISIYPNPVTDEVEIESNEKITGIKIFNSTGQELLSLLVVDIKIKIDMKNFPKGLYILQIQTGKNNFTKKIIKE